jgi:D-tyrosyl-tRNA(Tyr) deacylase
MRVIVQRVNFAKLFIDNSLHCQINKGILALIGIHRNDDGKAINWMINKIINLRLFDDEQGKMNLSVKDISGEIMLVSNFTLYGDANKGFRPTYVNAAPSDIAEIIYSNFAKQFINQYPEINIVSGVFGAMMDIELVNNGPVTILIEKEINSKN